MAKILVVEDDKYLSSAYKVKLEKEGFEVKNVYDGDEAMNALKTFTPDAIILDLVMPGKDGFSVLEEVRKMEQYKNTPIIAASNLGQKDDIDKSMSLGATDYVIKSNLSLNDLIGKIKRLLSATPVSN